MPALTTPKAMVIDYSGTIATGPIDPDLGERPVDPDAVPALRLLHGRGIRLILASNTRPGQTRWGPLRAAGVAELFSVALLSAALGVAKPDPLLYRLALSAARCRPDRVVWVGDNFEKDVRMPRWEGMGAILIRPNARLEADENLPPGARMLTRFALIPTLLDPPKI
jgi:FMN phosphatase YigB (HAD superfamily)